MYRLVLAVLARSQPNQVFSKPLLERDVVASPNVASSESSLKVGILRDNLGHYLVEDCVISGQIAVDGQTPPYPHCAISL